MKRDPDRPRCSRENQAGYRVGLAGNGPDRSGKELERYPARRQSEDCARSSRQKDAARLVLRALADLTAQLCQVLFHLLDNLIMAHGRPRL